MSHFDTPPVVMPASLTEVLETIARASKEKKAAVIATVIQRKGSTPATPGQKLVLLEDRTCVGTIGGGSLEHSVLKQMTEWLQSHPQKNTPKLLTFQLGPSLGMCCGGTVEVMLEPLVAPLSVLIVGAGHIATALSPLLTNLGFSVTVCDEREELIDQKTFPRATVVCGTARDACKVLSPERTAILVMTHDHMLDQNILEWAIDQPFSFVGGVGSRAKYARICTRLTAKGYPSVQLERIQMPVGVAIGARTPEEIAVAISATLISWRHGFSATTSQTITTNTQEHPINITIQSDNTHDNTD